MKWRLHRGGKKLFTVMDLVQPETMEEAYRALTSRRNNVVLGGCAFLKMGNKRIGTAIDLSKLNLDYIKENNDDFEIGAYTTLRELEVNPALNDYYNGVLGESVGDIIGIQFRNVVTIGASVFSKYGFSDLITGLLSLNTEVELYKGERMSLEEFLSRPYERDILIKIFIKKDKSKSIYKSFRNSQSDYAILNAAVSILDGKWKIVVGARPGIAMIASKASELLSKGELNEALIEEAAQMASNELTFGSNMRGSAEYRKAVSVSLIKKAVREVLQCK